MASPQRKARRSKRPNQVRIIGGEWRRRMLSFPDVGVRPTPDRVRETVFNLLGHHVIGARVLDLYAGTGALGLEALSRGAQHAVFVERDHALAGGIRSALDVLGGQARGVVQQANVTDALRSIAAGADQMFDVVFIDPPYAANALGDGLESVKPLLADGGFVYAEHSSTVGPDWLLNLDQTAPDGWLRHRSGQAGAVRYHLLRYRKETAA